MVKLNTKTFLQVTKGERIYSFECNSDSPLGEIHDVLLEMKGYVVQRASDAHEQDKPVTPVAEEVV